MIRGRASWYLLASLSAAACNETSTGSEGDGAMTSDDLPPACELEAVQADVLVPTCDPLATDGRAGVTGSGATWRIHSACRSPYELQDGEVLLRLFNGINPSECPDGIVIESSREPTPASAFARTPIYEISAASDAPCSHYLGGGTQFLQFILPPDGCGEPDVLYSQEGSAFTEMIEPWGGAELRTGAPVSIVAARRCRSGAFCAGVCLGPKELALDEGHCGACDEACSAVCEDGSCTGQAFDGPTPDPQSLATDGHTVYWSRPQRVIRRMQFDGEGAAIVDDLVADGDIEAWDAGPGSVAWIERLSDGDAWLRRLDDDGTQHAVAFPHYVPGTRGVQPTADVTVVAAADVGLLVVPNATGELTELVGCFDGSGSVRELALAGEDLLVMGDDGDEDALCGDVWRCSLDGSPGVELIDDAAWPEPPTGTWRMISVGDEVLLVGSENYLLSPSFSGLTTPLLPIDGIVASDGESLFLPTNDNIVRFRDGSNDTVLEGVKVLDLAVTAEHLVFVDAEHVGRIVAYPLR